MGLYGLRGHDFVIGPNMGRPIMGRVKLTFILGLWVWDLDPWLGFII